MNEILLRLLRNLTTREQEILQLRFGLIDGEPKTLEETGKQYGVTREWIRQIEAKALEKIRLQYDLELQHLRFYWNFTPYRCLCGKYLRKRFLGIFCERCGTQVQPVEDIIKAVKIHDNQKVDNITN